MEMSSNPVKYEVLIKQYSRSILDISALGPELNFGFRIMTWRRVFVSLSGWNAGYPVH